MLATATNISTFTDNRLQSEQQKQPNVDNMSPENRLSNGQKPTEKAVIEDEFSIYPGRVTCVSVKLTKNAVIYQKQTGNSYNTDSTTTTTLDLWDIVGVTCGRPKGRNRTITEIDTASRSKSDVGAYICLYIYPYNKPASEGGVRQRKETIFRYSKQESYESNLAVIQHWRIAVLLLLNGVEVQNDTGIALVIIQI